MSQASLTQGDVVQVCFRVNRATADLLNELAGRQVNGLRGLICRWLTADGHEVVAQRELARLDGRRRQPLVSADGENRGAM